MSLMFGPRGLNFVANTIGILPSDFVLEILASVRDRYETLLKAF